MNKDTQNIYEAYVTENQAAIDAKNAQIARLQADVKQLQSDLQQPGANTTSSSTSTSTPSPASSTTAPATNDLERYFSEPESKAVDAPVASAAANTAAPSAVSAPEAPAPNTTEVPSADPTEVTISPWKQEQERINQTAEMPDNWRNASWAKRARTMGGGNPARVKALAQKEWERKEAMRKEREMATSKLNPNRQSALGYNLKQVGKAPGNISAGLQGLGSAVFGKNKIPQTTAAGDAVRNADGKQQWDDNTTGRPGALQRIGGAVKKALTPKKPAPATPPAPPTNRRKSRVLNQSTNAFDAVLQDKNVDHLID